MTAWALVVGINKYSERSNLTELFGAVADAADFADWALSKAGGNVATEHMFFWTYPEPELPAHSDELAELKKFMAAPTRWPVVGPDFTRPPQASEIIRCIPEVTDLAVKAGAERLYVFFAGHGGQTKLEDAMEEPQNCFMAGDFDARYPTYGLVGCDDLRRYLQMVGPKELVLFFDCCRNTLPLKVGRPAAPYNRVNNSGRFKRLGMARAAQDEKVAYEVPNPDPKRGAFSTVLIGGLRQHRVDGKLTLKDLEAFVAIGIGELIKPPLEQIPDFQERPRPPEMLLVQGLRTIETTPVNATFSNVAIGTVFELRDQERRLIATETVTQLVHHFSLPPGGYSFELPGGGLLKAFNHVGPGETDVVV